MTTQLTERPKACSKTIPSQFDDVNSLRVDPGHSPDSEGGTANGPAKFDETNPQGDSFRIGRRRLPIAPPSLLRRRSEQLAACGLLVLASPVLALLALAVRLTSPGEILYQQVRSGIGGKEFKILKFRSMVADAEKGTGAVWASKDDPRVTIIGGLLRRLHLDELPQLLNIVRGEMAFVGPRPERPVIITDLEQDIPGYRDRLEVLPGVTGLAQINLDPDESTHMVKRKFELDLEYMFSSTTMLDFRIVLTTLLKMAGIPKEYATALFRLRRVPIVVVAEEPSEIDVDEADGLLDGTDTPEASYHEDFVLETVG